MFIYFEKLTSFDLLKLLFVLSNRVKGNSNDYFYFDISVTAHYFLTYIISYSNLNICKLDFEMTQVRDKNNELERLRIYREDLSQIHKELEKSHDFQIFNRYNQLSDRLPNYILRGLIDGEISVKGSIIVLPASLNCFSALLSS